jgi:hypothetical protein
MKVGDVVYTPTRLPDGKMKPSKVKISAVILTLTATGNKVDHVTESGERLPKTYYDNPWDCQKAIDILEKHGKMVDHELDELAATIAKDKEAANERK